MNSDNSLKGLGFFCQSIIHLISIGKTETINNIERCFEEKCIVEYIYEKYKPHFPDTFEPLKKVYNIETLNEYFYNYVGYIEGNEDRKYGVENSSDGLLLIVAVGLDVFSHNDHQFELNN